MWDLCSRKDLEKHPYSRVDPVMHLSVMKISKGSNCSLIMWQDDSLILISLSFLLVVVVVVLFFSWLSVFLVYLFVLLVFVHALLFLSLCWYLVVIHINKALSVAITLILLTLVTLHYMTLILGAMASVQERQPDETWNGGGTYYHILTALDFEDILHCIS